MVFFKVTRINKFRFFLRKYRTLILGVQGTNNDTHPHTLNILHNNRRRCELMFDSSWFRLWEGRGGVGVGGISVLCFVITCS